MFDDDYNGVALLDDEEEQRRRAVSGQPPTAPPTSITGPSEPATQPTSITAGPLDAAKTAPPLEPGWSSSKQTPLGPAAQREHDLLGQGPPQYHGWKKAADILGRVTAPGRVIEQGTGLGTLGYEARLGQAAKDAAHEQTLAKAPLDLSYEQAKTREQGSKARQEEAKAKSLENPPPKLENLQQEYADAVMDSMHRNVNPHDDPKVQQLADAITSLQKEPSSKSEPETVTMLDAPGGKPYTYQYDPDKTYTGKEGYDHWKKIGPAKSDAISMGLIGSLQPLLGANGEFQGTFNTKTGERRAASEAPPEIAGAKTTTGARLSNTQRQQFNTQYVKPSTDIEQNYRKFQGAYQEYQKNPATGAASMVALAQHLGSTFGSVKGAQMGEHMISEHKDAIGLFDGIGRYVDRVESGQQLSADQWKDFNDLITNTRQIQWETTTKEAARRHQPIDFVPSDVQINMADSAGKVRHVPGNKVQEYLDKGAQLAE